MTQIAGGQNKADEEVVQASRNFERLMLQFHQMLEDKVLPENKSQGQLNVESDLILRLLTAANEVDVLKQPETEGTFGLITLLIRSGLLMRDRANQYEYNSVLLERKIGKLEKQILELTRAKQRAD